MDNLSVCVYTIYMYSANTKSYLDLRAVSKRHPRQRARCTEQKRLIRYTDIGLVVY